MLERLPRTRRNVALFGLGVLTVWFAWTVRGVLNPLLIGYLGAYILLPFVVSVERRGYSRRTAANLIFAAGFVLVVLILVGAAWQLRGLAIDLLQSAKQMTTDQPGPGQGVPLHDAMQRRVDEFTGTLNEWGFDVEPWQVPDLVVLREQAQEFLAEYGEEAADTGVTVGRRLFSFLVRFLGGVFSLLGLFFLVPLYTYYFLFVMGDLHAGIVRYFPRRERARLARVFERIGEVISSFFRGRLAVAFLKGLFLAVPLTLFGIPYGFLIGISSGFLSIIPFVGAFVGFVLGLMVGILEHGVIGSAWRTALVFGAAELVEGYVLVPRILGDRLGLHPLVVFFALVAGGAAMGMFGLLIALPLTATLVILFQEFVAPALKQFADESP